MVDVTGRIVPRLAVDSTILAHFKEIHAPTRVGLGLADGPADIFDNALALRVGPCRKEAEAMEATLYDDTLWVARFF